MPPAFRAAPQPIVQRAETTGRTGKTRGMARLCVPPFIEHCDFAGFGPWQGRQIVRLILDRTRQEPQVALCRFSFTISLRGFHMISARYLRKWRGFLLCDFNFIMDFNRF